MAGPSFVPISFNATASSYIAYVRLPPTLMDKLEAEGASDMSISLSEGVLSVGGVSYKLDAVPEEGSFDVVREHGSKMCSVGAVRDKIIIKQTLDSAGRAQMKQRTAQGERDAHGHQTVSVEAPPPAAKRKTPTASKQVAKPSQQQRAKSARPLSTSPQGGAMSGTMTAPTGRTGSTGGLEDLRRWCVSHPARHTSRTRHGALEARQAPLSGSQRAPRRARPPSARLPHTHRLASAAGACTSWRSALSRSSRSSSSCSLPSSSSTCRTSPRRDCCQRSLRRCRPPRRAPRPAPPRAPRPAPPRAPRTAPPRAPRTAPRRAPRTAHRPAPRTAHRPAPHAAPCGVPCGGAVLAPALTPLPTPPPPRRSPDC
jgi:hypothetical protein